MIGYEKEVKAARAAGDIGFIAALKAFENLPPYTGSDCSFDNIKKDLEEKGYKEKAPIPATPRPTEDEINSMFENLGKD